MSSNGFDNGEPYGIPENYNAIVARNRKNMLKILALKSILKKHGISDTLPIEQTQYSYTQPDKSNMVVHKYKIKRNNQQKKKMSLSLSVKKNKGQHNYSYQK